MTLINEAVARLRYGGVVGLPTETVYGLAASIMSPAGIESLYLLKGRVQDKPMAVAIAQAEDILPWVTELPPAAEKLMANFWPGPLTLVLPASKAIPKSILSPQGGVGLRCSSCPLTRQVITALGHPLVLTSANISGQKEALTAEQVLKYFPGSLVLADDAAIQGLASTVIDVMVQPYRILRMGAISLEEIQKILGE